jgi:glycosyltransferase involved in cell wall biosynthesis
LRSGYPSISIVVTSLNRATFIERTILSVLRQDYLGPVQLIVADGGSTDGTVQILQKYPQITWWSRRDNGIVDAINQGLAAARGEYVLIQDSDNFFLPDAFRLTMDFARQHREYDIVTGCDVYLESDQKTFSCSQLDDHEITPRSHLMRRVIPVHCAFVKRRAVELLGGFRTLSNMRRDTGGDVGNVGVDIDFWYRALHLHRARFVPHHTCVYQHHPNQMSNHSPRWYANLTEMIARYESDAHFAGRFKFSDDDKRNLFIRWEIQQERLNGNEPRVRELVDRVMNDTAQFTDETRQFLMLHGFAPKPPRIEPKPRHPNHKVPDLSWWKSPSRVSKAA